MTKSDLIQAIGKDAGLSRAQAGKLVNEMFDLMTEALQKGEEVRITGFGTFRTTDTKERVGRNPRTGEEIRIPPSRRVNFAAGSGLLNTIRGSDSGTQAA